MSASLVSKIVPSNAPTANTAVTASSQPSTLRFENFKKFYDQRFDQQWQAGVVDRLVEFTTMPEGWDSYGGKAVKWDAGMFALNVLTQVMLPRTPLPQLVPSSDGGVQIEWHEKGIDLEVHITAPYVSELWYEDHASNNAPISKPLSDDLSDLQTAVRTLTAR